MPKLRKQSPPGADNSRRAASSPGAADRSAEPSFAPRVIQNVLRSFRKLKAL
jgi:hypothetical protein